MNVFFSNLTSRKRQRGAATFETITVLPMFFSLLGLVLLIGFYGITLANLEIVADELAMTLRTAAGPDRAGVLDLAAMRKLATQSYADNPRFAGSKRFLPLTFPLCDKATNMAVSYKFAPPRVESYTQTAVFFVTVECNLNWRQVPFLGFLATQAPVALKVIRSSAVGIVNLGDTYSSLVAGGLGSNGLQLQMAGGLPYPY